MHSLQGVQTDNANTAEDIIDCARRWLHAPLTPRNEALWTVVENPPTPSFRAESILKVSSLSGTPLVQFMLAAHWASYDTPRHATSDGTICVTYLDLQICAVSVPNNTVVCMDLNDLLIPELAAYRCHMPQVPFSMVTPSSLTVDAGIAGPKPRHALSWRWQLPRAHVIGRTPSFEFWLEV